MLPVHETEVIPVSEIDPFQQSFKCLLRRGQHSVLEGAPYREQRKVILKHPNDGRTRYVYYQPFRLRYEVSYKLLESYL